MYHAPQEDSYSLDDIDFSSFPFLQAHSDICRLCPLDHLLEPSGQKVRNGTTSALRTELRASSFKLEVPGNWNPTTCSEILENSE
jgi:hypothetical protein